MLCVSKIVFIYIYKYSIEKFHSFYKNVTIQNYKGFGTDFRPTVASYLPHFIKRAYNKYISNNSTKQSFNILNE